MPELTITLRRAKEMNACVKSYTAVRKALGRAYRLDTPLPLLRVLELRGLSNTLWALRCIPQEQADAKRWAVSNWLGDVLEHIESLLLDPRSRAVIPALRRHAVTPLPADEWRMLHAADAADADERQWQAERLRYWLEGGHA